jgi:hypothetical protein
MKSIVSWNDLACYGVDALTGEACGLSYRILCDVTEQGKRILAKALGVSDMVLPENWNRGSEDAPHVGSIMLAPEMLIPIGVFALLETGCTAVWRVGNAGLLGVEPSDEPEQLEAIQRFYGTQLQRSFAYRGTAGDRNQHVMTGRVH